MTVERYSKDHEYIRVEGGIATIGITHHAQEQLGDVVSTTCLPPRCQFRVMMPRSGCCCS